MRPTQEQIEAAAKAIAAETVEPKGSAWETLPEYLKQNCLREAKIALTAAAGTDVTRFGTDIVKRMREQQELAENNKPSAFIKDIWRCAADEIERARADKKNAHILNAELAAALVELMGWFDEDSDAIGMIMARAALAKVKEGK